MPRVVFEFAVTPSAAAVQLKRIYSLKMVSVSKDNEQLRTNGYGANNNIVTLDIAQCAC